MSPTNTTGIEQMFDSSRTPYQLPDPTSILDPDVFRAVFGRSLDSGSFGTITQSPNGGVRKVLAFSETPLVDLEGIHQNVKISHFNDKNYILQKM